MDLKGAGGTKRRHDKMIIDIYLLLMVLGFIFLCLGIYSGSYGARTNQDGIQDSKIGATVSFLMLSMILFSLVALNSMSVETEQCVNQITGQEGNSTNLTYSNSLSCTTQRYTYEFLAYLFSGLALYDVVMIFVYVVKNNL